MRPSILVHLGVRAGRIGPALLCLAVAGGAAAQEQVDYSKVGDKSVVQGLRPIKVEGIGFVTGLDDTGSDPPANAYRDMMEEFMRKKGVHQPKATLASPQTAIVLLRGVIPPGTPKGEMIDVEVWVPPGDSTTSLKGGYLLEADLSTTVVVGDGASRGARQGDRWAVAAGPVMVIETDGLNRGSAEDPDPQTAAAPLQDGAVPAPTGAESVRTDLKKGKILGRTRVTRDYDFRLILDESARSGHRTKAIAAQINQRFTIDQTAAAGPSRNPVSQAHAVGVTADQRRSGARVADAGRTETIGVAKAVNDRAIEVRIPPHYRHNLQRYLLVVRRIPLHNLNQGQFFHHLLSMLEGQLAEPATALEAAMRLEALGERSEPVLRAALQSPYEVVRFAAAEALAYLGEPAGGRYLGDLAEESVLYRPYALAALVSLGQPISRVELRSLMNQPGPTARYGAFRSLYLLDPHDPSIAGATMGSDQFTVHPVRSEGPPMVHVASHFRPEIVLFRPEQRLLAPLLLAAGDNIILTAGPTADADQVFVTYIEANPHGEAIRKQSISSLQLGEVIHHCAEAGATYPDIVRMLQQASEGGNLMGTLQVNALPPVLDLESLSVLAGAERTRVAEPSAGASPDLFKVYDADELTTGRPKLSGATRTREDTPAAQPAWYQRLNPFRRLGN